MADYLHSYEPQEQQRLQSQAYFLRHLLHSEIVVREGEWLLEIGCGVGAQLAILAEHPAGRLVGVDRSAEQLERARALLAGDDRLEWVQAQGEQLPFSAGEFDQVFLFFVLEHVDNPGALLREAERVLKKGGKLTVTEVNNRSLQLSPPSPAIDHYWQAYNQLQVDLGGDPEVGIKLANLALQAGFEPQSLRSIGPVLDARLVGEERQAVVDFWLQLFDSVRQRLIGEGRVSVGVAEQAFADLAALPGQPQAVLYYAGMQLVARTLK